MAQKRDREKGGGGGGGADRLLIFKIRKKAGVGRRIERVGLVAGSLVGVGNYGCSFANSAGGMD